MEKIFQNEINEFLNKEIEKEEKEKNECDEIFKMKFKTKKYYINEKGKKRRIKKERKYKSDDIRKKIKVKFHKTIKNIININNKHTVEYLEENEEISINSGFYFIKDMKYKDMLEAYFSSKQFENSIIELKNKNESIDYIQKYIKLSKEYLNYFSSNKKNDIKNSLNEELGNYLTFDYLDNFNKDITEYQIYFNKKNE